MTPITPQRSLSEQFPRFVHDGDRRHVRELERLRARAQPLRRGARAPAGAGDRPAHRRGPELVRLGSGARGRRARDAELPDPQAGGRRRRPGHAGRGRHGGAVRRLSRDRADLRRPRARDLAAAAGRPLAVGWRAGGAGRIPAHRRAAADGVRDHRARSRHRRGGPRPAGAGANHQPRPPCAGRLSPERHQAVHLQRQRRALDHDPDADRSQAPGGDLDLLPAGHSQRGVRGQPRRAQDGPARLSRR